MSNLYFYPGLISLENIDFEKLDILPGTPKFAVADFAILNAGSIYDLSITVDRDGQNLIKSCSNLIFSESGSMKFAEDVSGTSYITGIIDNGLTLSNKYIHSNIINASNGFENTLKGIIFVKMITSIFDVSEEYLATFDFSDPTQRSNAENKFFDNDETLELVNDIKLKTIGLDSSGNGNGVDDSGNIVYINSAFNQTITSWYGVSGESILNSEVEYWNTRTSQDISGNETETEHIYFNPNDKLMVMYSVSTTFLQSSDDNVGNFRSSVDNLSAFRKSDNVVQDTLTLKPGIGNLNFDSRFILEYNVNPPLLDPYLTGHKFTDPSGGYTAWSERPTGSLRNAVDQWIDGSWNESVGGHISTWDTSEVTDFSFLFYQKYDFNEDLSHWDVSSGTSMERMLATWSDYNQPMGDWDVSSVRDMSHMFEVSAGSNFNQDISEWDVSSVTDMKNMFNKAIAFNQPLNKWRVDNVTDMTRMFFGDTSSLGSVGIHPFNHPLFQWNVSKVTSMSEMFRDSLFNQDISGWDTTTALNNLTWNNWPLTFDMFLNCPISEENKAPGSVIRN